MSGLRMDHGLEALAARLDGLAPWLTVRTAPEVPGPEWISCASTLSAQVAGGDPTASWRAVLETEYGRQYGIDPPRQVAAMFVLMWYVGVPARIASASSALTGYAPDVSPERVAFRLHPTQHFPTEVALLPGPVLSAARAVEVSNEHCRAFVDSYRSGVKLGSRQRYGAVADEYRAAIKACAGSPYAEDAARLFGVDVGESVRESCCYLYALPGVTACSTCPRFRQTGAETMR